MYPHPTLTFPTRNNEESLEPNLISSIPSTSLGPHLPSYPLLSCSKSHPQRCRIFFFKQTGYVPEAQYKSFTCILLPIILVLKNRLLAAPLQLDAAVYIHSGAGG